jgi:hypothetical protein
MSHDRILRPGAHRSSAVLLAALAALDLAWTVRDFGQAADVTDAWWMWSGLIFRAQDGIWATSFVDPTLLILYTVCAVTAAVSSAATGVLISTGALTILLRVPTLWNLNASWVRAGVSDGLRNLVLFSAIAMLVMGAALIVLAVAGRVRAAPSDDASVTSSGTTPRSRSTRDEPPAPPTRRGAVAAFLLLSSVTAVLASWEIHSATEQGWELYSHHFTGDRALATLLAVPESWYGCVLALVSLTAALAALARTPYSRALGMTVSGPLLGQGLFHLSYAAKSGLMSHLGNISLRDQLWLCTAAFEILAALAVLLALAAHGGRSADRAPHSGTVRAFSSA